MNENDFQKRKAFLEEAELFLNKSNSLAVLSLKDKAAFVIIIGLVALLIWQGWNHYRQAVTGSIEISMKTGVADTAQLFYDIGKGFSETDSSRVNIVTINPTTAHSLISVFSSGARCKHGGFSAEST